MIRTFTENAALVEFFINMLATNLTSQFTNIVIMLMINKTNINPLFNQNINKILIKYCV